MIKAFTTGPNAVITLGLSRANVELLMEGHPIRFAGADVKQPHIAAVYLVFGETEDAIEQQLREAGLITGAVAAAHANTHYEVGLAGMSREALSGKLRTAIATVEHILPGTMVALFAFDRSSQNMAYIADANRQDVAKAVSEWAKRVSYEGN